VPGRVSGSKKQTNGKSNDASDKASTPILGGIAVVILLLFAGFVPHVFCCV